MSSTDDQKYDIVAVGGTFDHFHDGHQLLLEKAVGCCKRELIIGITGAPLLKNKKYSDFLQPFDIRKSVVLSKLKELNPDLHYRIVELLEPNGPTINESDIQAIVVSKETEKGALEINRIRGEKGFLPLEIITIDLVPNLEGLNSEDNKLSSTSLREKEWRESQKNTR